MILGVVLAIALCFGCFYFFKDAEDKGGIPVFIIAFFVVMFFIALFAG